MAKRKYKKLTEAELLSACRRRSDIARKYVDTNLSRERRETNEFYQGIKPLPAHQGQSTYRSLDVYNAVEGMKAQLLETFAAGSNIASFPAMNKLDAQAAKVATAYAETQFFKLNDGLEIMSDVMHDGLMARVGIVKVYWEAEPYIEEHEFEDATNEQLEMEADKDDVDSIDAYETGVSPEGEVLYSGTVNYKRDRGQVRILPIPPEEFLIETRFKDLSRARYVAHRTIKTLGELCEAGYPKDKVYSISGEDDDLEMNEEALLRREKTDGMNAIWGRGEDAPDEASKEVVVYESYIRIDFKGTGVQQLWRVVHAGDVLLEKQEVDRLPFKVFRPIPVPHTFWGENFAEKVIPVAKVKTVITRAVLDATVRGVSQRLGVVKGGVSNPRELIDNRVGGIVNVTRPDAVFPLPIPQIPPQALTMVDRADADREDVTGISRLSQGLSKDAVSQQNSQGLVENLISNSQVRQTVIAKLFANQVLKEIYLEIYALGIENDDADRMLEVAGEFVEINPSTWPERKFVNIDLELGYGSRDKKVAELLTFHKELSADPGMARMYDEGRKYAVISKALEIKGYRDVDAFLNNPDKMGPPEPNPKEIAELEKLKAEVEIMQRKQQVSEVKTQHELRLEELEFEFKQRLEAVQAQLKEREVARKERETENRIDISLGELEIAAAQYENVDPERARVSAIISPNS